MDHPGIIKVYKNGTFLRECPVAEWPETQRFKPTAAGLIPVVEVDGRAIGSRSRGPVVEKLQQLYVGFVEETAAPGR